MTKKSKEETEHLRAMCRFYKDKVVHIYFRLCSFNYFDFRHEYTRFNLQFLCDGQN
jgi:hypothetical protein